MEYLALNRKTLRRIEGAHVPSRGGGEMGGFCSVTENRRVSHGGRSLSKHKL